jgi:ribosomal protein S18 acetylase RimI-like enzyme
MKILELKNGNLENAPKDAINEVAKYYSAMRYGNLARCRKFCANSNLIAFYCVNDKIVGAIRSTSDEVRFAYLIDLFVHPDFRKKGIGSSLLIAICQYYGKMKIDYIELDTDPADPGLNIFYQKCGLEEEKKSKVFYWKHKK